MSVYKLDMEKYAALARQAAAEGCVLIKNEKKTLPLKKGDRIAVFGRIADTYYKSGLGSGGMVNTSYVVTILDALRQEKEVFVEEKVREIYTNWIKEHPFDEGSGWGRVPWSQQEMPVSDVLFEVASNCDVALVVIGRTAGEDQDNKEEAGSYLLTEEEKNLIKQVSDRFERTAILLNVGNIIDMKWVEECDPGAVLYVWQGGQEGGNGVADVLMGRVNPCGKMTDTIAYEIADYPSSKQFGNKEKNYYEEDIYVGYRYFETFAKDKVLYPFGYGLSYTDFEIKASLLAQEEDNIKMQVFVENTGLVAGKEVVQLYVSAPQGKLGKPDRVLVGFAKTKLLQPGEKQNLEVIIPKKLFSSYDDAGVTGYKSAFVLEKGNYDIYVGNDVRTACLAASIEEEFRVLEQCEEALAPTEVFERIRPNGNISGERILEKEKVPTRTATKKKAEALEEITFTGNKGYTLADVYRKKVSMDEFVAQLTDEELITLQRGEGMCSPKVTPGTAAAFGGLTDSLQAYGIPALCATDGPSGIRMDCGTQAFSLPNGTLLGCTFNLELVEELYEMTGRELRQNRIDTLLGPGINLHRHPLNGRNFEYVSEDPLLTGKMAVAQLKGLGAFGSSGTIKHFSTNNQETFRRDVNAVVSERALRELYLKCFEIAVKEGNCKSVMTTYGPLNGLWTAGNYDLNTAVLRKEWGFQGIVMTDWWAAANDEGEPSDMKNRAAMVQAQNDLIMVTRDASNHAQDNILESLQSGKLTRAQLQRNAKNILTFALDSVAMEYKLDMISHEELEERRAVMEKEEFIPEEIVYYPVDSESNELVLDGAEWNTNKGTKLVIGVKANAAGFYDISLVADSELDELAQLPVSIYFDNVLKASINFRGTAGELVEEVRDLGLMFGGHHYIKLYFGASGIHIKEMKIKLREEFKMPF